MKDLKAQFPGVRRLQVDGQTPQELIAAYLEWHLMVMDDNVNLLLSRKTDLTKAKPNDDLVILEGELAQVWLRLRGSRR